MECNKDEAKRAMDIAERKITEKDYNGAKKFANKAQNLFPELDGLKHLLAAIDVYISGEKNIYGDADWYGILGVDPFANDDAVKKQYRKLVLMLHPDKNKCNGAEGAFELLSQAWNQLNCNHGFVAQEITPPSFVPKPPVNLSSNQQHRSSKNQASNKKSYGPPSSRREPAASVNHNFQWDSLTRMAGSNSRNATNQAANVVQQAQLKRELGESRERDAARGFTNSDLRNFKKPKTDDSHLRRPLAGNQTGARNVGNGNTETPNTLGSRHTHVQGMLLPCDITKALMERGQAEIFKRLPKMISEMKAKFRETDGEKKSMKATSKMSGKANEVERSIEEIPHASDEEKDDEVKTINVPDSDFHNFDLDRSESSFKDDQIWAAYDDDDGMPRFYARIHKVISLNPFKMKISWLNSKGTSEFGPIDWMGAGFAKTCGEFRSGRHEPTDTLNAFSHKVHFTKGARGFLHILPKKGQVWALYRNWSPEWDKNTPDEVKHKYEMVEVLDDCTEDKQSVTVTLLLKAEGFRAVFRRSTDGNDVREIQKEEMLRFSHQVPHYILTGKEADNAPEGCLELDPAATP
ncbi:PREDICTED: uncharacterized protein LOC104778654 [Camelina sativa]|uniref:Uncharacterized protein LOC104778654 n=1 Tax=Camelina sativa TaxID=90675 RepID=A0ABM0YII6_CAMSA|nr:PREDICTED: uncharacterized protein LOC104778654 [Camelina sativa]